MFVFRIHLANEKVYLTTSQFHLVSRLCGWNLSTKWTIKWKLMTRTRPTRSRWVRRVRWIDSHLCELCDCLLCQ